MLAFAPRVQVAMLAFASRCRWRFQERDAATGHVSGGRAAGAGRVPACASPVQVAMLAFAPWVQVAILAFASRVQVAIQTGTQHRK
jgi:hypothetical protein